MSYSFEVSRVKLIPRFDITIPNFIIKELAKHLNLKIDTSKLQNSLYKAKIITFLKKEDSLLTEDYADLPIFVNYDLSLSWTPKVIYRAYSHLSIHYDHTQYNNIKADFDYNPITPSNINSYDLILVYAACRYHQIDTLISNKDDLVPLLRKYLNQSVYNLRNTLIAHLNKYAKAEMFKLTHLFSKNHPEINYQQLNKLIQSEIIKNDYNVAQNDYEAIIYAAQTYNVDLTKVSNPLITYNNILKQPQIRNNVPNLSQEFNPNLNIQFYSERVLETLLKRYGIESTLEWNKLEKYSKCHEFYFIDTFEAGIKRPNLNTTTPIYQYNIETINSRECISYGNDQSGYYICTFEELYQTFKHYQQPVHPHKPQQSFTKVEINQIMLLCNSNNSYAFKIKKKLIYILSLQSDIPSGIKTLQKCDVKILTEAFKLFTTAAMMMRGWDGKGVYPIEETLVKDQAAVDLRVNISLSNFRNYIEKQQLKEILNLPLVEYKNDQFFVNKIENKGLTIGERLQILKDDRNINSCIRTTSNWILASIYKYSLLLKIKPDFDINKVRKIG